MSYLYIGLFGALSGPSLKIYYMFKYKNSSEKISYDFFENRFSYVLDTELSYIFLKKVFFIF